MLINIEGKQGEGKSLYVTRLIESYILEDNKKVLLILCNGANIQNTIDKFKSFDAVKHNLSLAVCTSGFELIDMNITDKGFNHIVVEDIDSLVDADKGIWHLIHLSRDTDISVMMSRTSRKGLRI